MKTKHLILAAILAASSALQAASAERKLPAPMPEFKTSEQLAKWREEKAKANATTESKAKTTNASGFYTGKTYLEETGTYSFLFRSFDPELTRWTTTDPSGFPDGANNSAYAPTPTFSLDWQGLMEIRFELAYGIEEIQMKWRERYGIIDMGIPGGPTLDWFETGQRTETQVYKIPPNLPNLPNAQWVDVPTVIKREWTAIVYTDAPFDPIEGSLRWALQGQTVTTERMFSYTIE